MRATVLGRPAGSAGLAARLERLAARLGESLGAAHSTFSVMLTDDAGIRDYNRRFRDRDEPTDVLSFPAGGGDATQHGHYLGDIVISVDRARAQGAEHGHDTADEAEVLLLHGVLHLMGHDHEADDGAMRELEARLALELFGQSRGLIARSEPDGSPGA